MAAPPSSSEHQLQNMLQAAVQAVHWTYSIFWKYCPQQGMLVWGDGYYNGAIKTRKTVHPVEVSTEEAALHRSQQLRELYESLSAGDLNHPTRRPSAALSPEDLTESEWFYLMCVSFSFPVGVGLPGNAYAKRRHMWLAGANDADSKFFTRAILAKSARVQTVICIPLLDGVVELGTTDRIEENLKIIQRVKSYFQYDPASQSPKLALSDHSTSNLPGLNIVNYVKPPASNTNDNDDSSEEDDDNDDDDNEESDYNIIQGHNLDVHNKEAVLAPVGSINRNIRGGGIDETGDGHELMMVDMSDQSIRLGSPVDGSTNLDSDFDLLKVGQLTCPVDKQGSKWERIQDSLLTPSTGAFPSEELHVDNHIHYSQTVTTILHSTRRDSSAGVYPTFSAGVYPTFSSCSAFTICTNNATRPRSHHRHVTNKPSQCLLKYILFNVPYLHGSDSPPRLKKSISQEELSANHVLAERRRREKLNEKFITLRSLVPFVTKMDKASILGDTIEYVKQLRKKIQDLEARDRQVEDVTSVDQRLRSGGETRRNKRKKMRAAEMAQQTAVEVSIIGTDGLVEMKCPYKEGLLLDVMIKLREFGMEITAVHSSSSSDKGDLVAELRAKHEQVKENIERKKASIMEVKRAIKHMII